MKINSAVFTGSIFINRMVFANKLLAEVNCALEASYACSASRDMAGRVLSLCSGWFKNTLLHANITRAIISFISLCMVNLKRWSVDIAENIYCGSLFLDAIGRAAHNSICIR